MKAQDLPHGWSTFPGTITGYRVNYTLRNAFWSMFQRSHNEFWMIWTDILPCLFFSFKYAVLGISSPSILAHCLFWGIISSRVMSAVYHIFNCMSLRMNQTLIYLDLIGIAGMALGSPLMFFIAFKPGPSLLWDYTCLMLSLYAMVAASFALMFFMRISISRSGAFCQFLLIVLACIGNIALLRFREQVLIYYTAASALMLFSYLLFYIYRFPDSLLQPGSADGRLWHSHVLWHASVSVVQYLYMQQALKLLDING